MALGGLLEAGVVPAGMRVTLVVLGVLTAVFLAFLALVLVVLRRREKRNQPRVIARVVRREHVQPRLGSVTRSTPVAAAAEVAPMAAEAPAPVADRVVCPACRRDFDADTRVCPTDGRRLVPRGDHLPRRGAAVCPRCRRGYDAGVEVCAFDGEELVVPNTWEAAPPRRRRLAPTGVVARTCPQCGSRFDLAQGTCPIDGAELITIN